MIISGGLTVATAVLSTTFAELRGPDLTAPKSNHWFIGRVSGSEGATPMAGEHSAPPAILIVRLVRQLTRTADDVLVPATADPRRTAR